MAELSPLVAFKGVTGFGSKQVGPGVHKIVMYGSEHEVDNNYTEGENGEENKSEKSADLSKEKTPLVEESGKFIDDKLEADYQKYLSRKAKEGKKPRPREEWKTERDYWLNDSPMARGNSFNKKAIDNDWYPYNEVNLGNGKRLDSYKPPNDGQSGEIVSRKATDLDMIELSTFESYLDEMLKKYKPGTPINSPKYKPFLDNATLDGDMFLEVPASNQSAVNIQNFINLANKKGITIRFQPE